jgi:serine/threonine protein kinase
MVLSKLKKMFFGGGGGRSRVNIKERFDIKGKSGQGSMSQVYKAWDRKLKKTVCLKILDKEKTAKFESRFVGLKKPSEGQISVELRHPRIVETMEYGTTTTGEQFLLMEWVSGSGLQAMIEASDNRLDGNRLNVISQLAEALEYIHEQKYVHRDICPRNVIFLDNAQIKLIDFGLTVPYRPEFCKPGNRTGTPQYLALEIIKRSSTDHRVDLFALGVTAYEMFTNQLPWGPFESAQLQLSAMTARPATDPREHVPEMDEATALFLMKSIEREPPRRYQTAAEVREAIKKLPKW